ncbi:MBL fold metallo-hydrolase [Euzebya tangerina]|uniref:MBL fold metallo-hydrolase n=1 Tax=Euzebya tangerina TaxID=591198 RepID=UPI000E30D37A|nr:MBL fold metallo-hydrolase [Euzebya tangerina]
MTPSPPSRRSRRAVLRDLGRTSVGLLVVGAGLGGCESGSDPVVAGSPDRADQSGGPSEPVPEATDSSSAAATAAAGTERAIVELGFVAAYIVSRAGEAALIDTGVEGSAGAIEEVLAGLGLEWASISDVVVTHSHGDHAGSLAAVAERAPDAAIWAGAADLDRMNAGREIVAVGDGDQVFGMDIIETPGHTPGHISVLDDGVLYTGDALVGGGDGRLAGPSERFTDDLPTAIQSVAKLGGFDVSTINVFHGFPVTGAAADLTALAESLS